MIQDNFSSLLHVDDRLTQERMPRKMMASLLEQKDTTTAVQALSPTEFYDLFHAVGGNDAMLLLEYANAEQVQTCLDLDIWQGDALMDSELAPWIEALVALPDEKFQEFWNGIDPEIMALFLHRNVHLYVAENKDDVVEIPDGESKNIAQSPDFTYWIAYPEDDTKAELVKQLVDKIYTVLGVQKAWSVLEGMHWEMATDLEETAYRFRTERIREYGFMPREEAAAIFTRVKVTDEIAEIQKWTSADLYIEPYMAHHSLDGAIAALDKSVASNCYFEAILAKCTNREQIKFQMFAVAQQIATYDGYQPHEWDGFEDSMLWTVCYANLGLEYCSQCCDELAVKILLHTPLHRLVTLGFNVTLELQNKAKILVSRGHLSIIKDAKLSLLTNDQRDVIEGLLEPRPRPQLSAMTPFVSAKDISRGALVIADIATRELFFGEALHKTRDDISLLAYTHELVSGVENVNFDNVIITFLTRKKITPQNAWDVIYTDELPMRNDVIAAISYEEIRTLFKEALPESNDMALRRLAEQLRKSVDETWPESKPYPDLELVNVLVFATRDES